MEEQGPDSQGFITIIPRKKKKKGRAPKFQESSFSDRLNSTTAKFERSDWLKQCCDIIQKRLESLTWDPSEICIFCLGLGSPTELRNSLAQLAFITLICDAFRIDRSKVSFFDPLFSEEDVKGLLEMGYVLPSENKRGKYTFDQRTLLFMPHCSVKLYENVLRSNWDIKALQHVLILGNSLTDYITSMPEWKLETTLPCISRVDPGKYLTCDPLPNSETHYAAFNNTALQHVEARLLSLFDETIWQLPDEVNKDDAEII